MSGDIGTKIRTRREELKLSQAAVAKRARMSRAHLTRIEGGKILPRLDTVEKVAKCLRTSAAALLVA